MDSIFKIDFDNSDQFPVLNGILNYLDKFTPCKNLEIFEAKEYNAKIYNGEINKNAETSEQAKKDVNRIIGKIKSSMIKMSVSIETANYFERLFKERDKLAINIPDSQRDYNIKTYNRHIIQKIEKYEYRYSFFLSIFDEYFDASQLEKLNMKNLLRLWYEKFGETKTNFEDIKQAESEQLNTISNKKIKWLGNASHLGFIIYQLAEKGFIEFPNYNGEINYTGLAVRVLNAFEFIDKQPNKKYLSEQINPDSENNKIAEVTKGKLKIDIADLKDLL